MKYEIWGGELPAVTFTLDRGESVYTQSGGLSWMSDGIKMETNARGGFGRSIGRLFMGESIFMVNYTAERSDTSITFSASLPGTLKVFRMVPGQELIAQKQSFLCATQGIELSVKWSQKARAGLFGGEGFILESVKGDGLAFFELDGSLREYELAPGEVMKVDTGNVALFEASVSYDIETVKGAKNVFFGGEGLFLTVLKGPGRVWLQTMTVSEMARRLTPYIPTGGD